VSHQGIDNEEQTMKLGRPMPAKLVKRVFSELETRLNPRVSAPIGSIILTAAHRDRCVVRFADGDWIHRYQAGTVVQPFLGGASARLQDEATSDIFLYGYRPKDGDTVIDLGAGVGGEVRLLSRLVGPAGRVVSVEAHPRIFRCLQRNIELNRLDNVTALQCAATGVRGKVLIEDGSETHLFNAITADETNSIAVPGETLADIVLRFGINEIDLLKLNIEGAELAVLKAASDVLPSVRNLVVSCHDFIADIGGPDWQRTYGPVCALLADAGYVIRTRPNDPRPWVPYYVYASR